MVGGGDKIEILESLLISSKWRKVPDACAVVDVIGTDVGSAAGIGSNMMLPGVCERGEGKECWAPYMHWIVVRSNGKPRHAIKVNSSGHADRVRGMNHTSRSRLLLQSHQ